MQRRNFQLLSLFTASSLVVLGLAGCGSAGTNEQPAAPGAGSTAEGASPDGGSGVQTSGIEGEAVLSYGDKKYTVQLELCSLYDTGDALFHGLALDDAGNEVGFLEGDFNGLTDSPHGEARLDFGATAKMQSMETFIAMGDAGAEIVITDFSEGSLIVMGGVWDENGTVLSTGTLKVTC